MAEHFLRIGGITVALRCAPGIVCQWTPATSRFLVPPSEPDIEAAVRTGVTAAAPGPPLFDSGAVWRLFAEGDGYRIETRAPMFGAEPYRVAVFEPTFRRGEIVLSPAAAERGVNPLEYPLDEILVSNLLGRGRGIELHSCGLVDHDGNGRLFVGVSGAGKTTTARLWGDSAAEVLSDDRVIVREDQEGIWMYGTPWHGEEAFASPASAPLSRLFFLHQAPQNSVRSMRGADTLARLFGCCFPPFYDKQGIAFTLEMLADVIERVPCAELSFVPDARVVDFVRAGT